MFERVAGGDGQRRAIFGGQRPCRLLELGGAHVGGGRIDQVAHVGGGGGEADGPVDLGDLGCEQDARAALGGVARLVAGEAMLAEQPAQGGGAGFAAFEPVAAGVERFAEAGEAPWGQRFCVGDGGHHFIGIAGAGKDREPARVLAVESGGGEQCAARGGLTLEPVGGARFVDQMDRMRGLAAIGLEKGGKIGHVATI